MSLRDTLDGLKQPDQLVYMARVAARFKGTEEYELLEMTLEGYRDDALRIIKHPGAGGPERDYQAGRLAGLDSFAELVQTLDIAKNNLAVQVIPPADENDDPGGWWSKLKTRVNSEAGRYA